MKDRLQGLARRIDALTVRERAIMAVSLAAALAALADVLVLSPQFAAQRAGVERMKQAAAELQALRARVAAPEAQTPSGMLAHQIDEQRRHLAMVDAAITERLGTGQAASLPALLQRVLRRHERLTLVQLQTRPPVAADAAARRSVELRVSGRYADLVAYLTAIEAELPGLRWASLQIDAAGSPPLLTARWWLPGEGS